MPLFTRRTDPYQTTHESPYHISTRHSIDSPHHRSGPGFFSRRRNSSTSSSSLSTTRRHSTANHTSNSAGSGLAAIFHRTRDEDPSIAAARQRVLAAEQAERDADAALAQARAAVKDARNHVRLLEREAGEEARLARIKQGQARDLGRRAKPLGRHGVY